MEHEKRNDFIRCRVSGVIKDRLASVAKEKAADQGRFVSLTEVILEAIQYGLPFVEKDIRIGIDTTVPSLSKSEQMLSAVRVILEKGFQAIEQQSQQPGAAA